MIQNPEPVSQEVKVLNVTSEAFNDRTYIPTKFTCDGTNVNPPLIVRDIPPQTKCLVLIVDDPDAPNGTWTHWLVWDIAPSGRIPENSIPGIEGLNDFKNQHYGGPCPPSATHHYHFKVYALDKLVNLKPGSGRSELEQAIQLHIIGYGELTGLYKRAM